MTPISLDVYSGILEAVLALAVCLAIFYGLRIKPKDGSLDTRVKFNALKMKLFVGLPVISGLMGLFHFNSHFGALR